MISVVISTYNSAETLPATLESLVPAAVQGLVREVVVVDGGSSDLTLKIADGYGAVTLSGAPLRASRLASGAQQARFPWLLFLNADCVLDPGWEREAEQLIAKIDDGRRPQTAASFRYVIDDEGLQPRLAERFARWSAALFGLSHAEQGLLVPRALYTEAGGFRPYRMLAEVDLTRRFGRRRLMRLRTPAVSPAIRSSEPGYAARAMRYYGALGLYALHVPNERIASWFGGARKENPAFE